MKHRFIIVILAICCILWTFQSSFAAVSAEQAAQLKTTLTPLGAQRAGSKDGVIPPWTGGYTTVPPGYVSGNPRPDPYANDKPLFTITKANMAKYADKLDVGTKALLTRLPGYRLDVYPTHRPAAAPQYVYDNTFKNATRATTTTNGLNVQGAYGGIPFPIPQNGYQVMWNSLLSWCGQASDAKFKTWTLTADGTRVLNSYVRLYLQWPYYFPGGWTKETKGFYWDVLNVELGPPFKAGEVIMFRDSVNPLERPRQAWQYLVGQRRVRLAPSIAYDTPNNVTSGQTNYDDIYMFSGALDRYNWKLIGKKEMYIPYDGNKIDLKTPNQALLKHMVNPDDIRWELHRVWIVDATLAPGKRHTVPHRRMYIDEDDWKIMIEDQWDAAGSLWKVMQGINCLQPEYPAVVLAGFVTYNLISRAMVFDNCFINSKMVNKKVPPRPESFYSPAGLAAMGIR